MLSTPGESDSESGASAPDEPVPGQTHDRPQWRHQQKGWPVADRRHSPLPHQAELCPRHPRCGGELPVCQHVDLDFNCSAPHVTASHHDSLRLRPPHAIWTPTTCLCWSPRKLCLSGGVWAPVTRRWRPPSTWWATWVAAPPRCQRARNLVSVLEISWCRKEHFLHPQPGM